MRKIITMMIAALTLAACAPKQQEESATKTLVLYYSQTGVTEKMALELQSQLGADIEAIEVEQPYDGDFASTIERCKREMAEGVVPSVKPIKADLNDYDQIFLCYPVWFGTYAAPIAGLVKNVSFAGKKVIACCTFGSGGLQSSTEALKAALPEAEVIEGYGVRAARIDKVSAELNRFLIEHFFKEGEVEALPAFMEHQPVTDEEKAVFDEACADYQFPLGTPIDVAVREMDNVIDYEFTVESQNEKGESVNATIYVTKDKAEGAKAEFTQVVR